MQEELIRESARALGLELDQGQVESFLGLLKLLRKWNKSLNLTSITKNEDIVIKHFLDSLSCILSKKIKKGATVVDIGSGAGFPGIPIKIAQPSIDLTLLDSSRKRVRFLNEAIARLELSKTEALHVRAEDFAREKGREAFDVALTRAVASFSVLLEYGLPLVRRGGHLIVQKGKETVKECESAEAVVELLGGSIEKVLEVAVPNLSAKRFLIIVRKNKPTPHKFPRKAGIPTKRPLTDNKVKKNDIVGRKGLHKRKFELILGL